MPDEIWKNCGLIYKIAHETKWLLIFHHEASTGKFTMETAAFNLEKNKFSYISRISNPRYVKRFNDSYEFLLEYPNEFQGEYNRWLQDKDPTTEWDNGIDGIQASGFSPIFLNWKDNFGGLMRDSSNSALLNGQTKSVNWNYAIGDCSNEYISSGVTPGITENIDSKGNYKTTRVTSVYLWIRVGSIVCNLCTKIRKYPFITRNMFISIFLFSLQ